MSKIFDGGPAFPRERKFHYEADTKPGSGMIHDPPQDGMSLRVWFAGMALQGLIANGEGPSQKSEWARVSFEYADAMIAVLEKGGK